MEHIHKLLEQNKAWVEKINEQDPDFFKTLAKVQTPEVLWIGCSDSRVPANQIVDVLPGDLFVHRNVANLVPHSDINSLSVVQFAVEVLKVRHIVVCGHYRCGGIQAAFSNDRMGIIENWIAHIVAIKRIYNEQLQKIENEKHRFDLLCELNVLEQVRNVADLSCVRDVWEKGDELYVHGWIYDVADGLIHNLDTTIGRQDSSEEVHHSSVKKVLDSRGVSLLR